MVAHVLAYFSVCLLTQPNMPLDMVEMLFWGQQWQLGYHKHPPLPAWIAASAWSLGGGHPWLIYLFSQLTVVTTFWAVWQFAREELSPWAALCSVLVLEGCYYCTFTINDINNTIVTRPFWALAILFLYRAMVREKSLSRNSYWLLTGIAIGLGMISKYYMGILVLAMLGLPLLLREARRHLKTVGPWLTVAVALMIFAPHAIWVVDNDFITFQYVFQRSSGATTDSHSWFQHVASPVDFVVRQLPAIVPVFVLATPLLLNRRRGKPNPRADHGEVFFQRYLVFVFAGPILIYLLIGLITGSPIRSMWGGPLFSFLGVALFTFIALPEDQQKVHKIARDSLCIGAVMVIALAGRNVLGPVVRGKYSRVHFPGKNLAETVNKEWNSRFDCPLPAVGGALFEAGCAGIYSPSHVDVYGSMSSVASPWLNDDILQKNGGVIVWKSEHQIFSAQWLKRFEDVEVLEPITLSMQSPLKSEEFAMGMAIVCPASPTQTEQRQAGDRSRHSDRTAKFGSDLAR